MKSSPVLYISRHGESEMNLKKIIGGNGNLSPNGQKYGIALGDYIRSTIDQNNTRFITSTLNRTLQTAKLAQVDIFDKDANLDEINAGDYDQLTYEQIREFYPIEYKKRAEDKLGYRYPNGESYIDLSLRVNESLKKLDFMTKENVYDNHSHFKGTILIEFCHQNFQKILSSTFQKDHFLICHQAVARCILGILLNLPKEEIPHIEIPLHTVLKLENGKLSYEKII